MADRYEDTPEGQVVPPPAAIVNGRKIHRLYAIEGAPDTPLYVRLVDAIQGAEKLSPVPRGPTEAA